MSDEEASQKQAIHALVEHVAQRLAVGESPAAVRANLIAEGLDSQVADQVIEGLTPPPAKWEGGVPGWTLRIGGIAAMLAGGVLWLGNQIGFLPTFPFAGTLVVFAGAALFVLGGGK